MQVRIAEESEKQRSITPEERYKIMVSKTRSSKNSVKTSGLR
jgi:hypothetical protein